MNYKIILLIFILAISIISCKKNIKTVNKPISGFIDLQGHRGARGMRFENSLSAFKYCLEQNVTTLELDLNMTKDRKLLLHHDRETTPLLCTDGSGTPIKEIPIKNLTLAELKKLECGTVKHKIFPEQILEKSTLITLDEFFDFIQQYEKENKLKSNIRFNIEIKFFKDEKIDFIDEMAKITVQTIEKYKMTDRATIQSFTIKSLPIVKKYNNKIITIALFLPSYYKGVKMLIGLDADRKEILEKAIKSGASIISPHYIYANHQFIKNCHDKNIKIIPWTVNKKSKMIQLFNYGVDGIISDYPGRLYQTHKEWIKNNTSV